MPAQLLPIDLVSPGFRGVNFERAQSILPPFWATKAQNMVIDSDGRLAARKGYSDVTTTEITATPAIKTLHEYVKEDTTTELIQAWNGGIGNDIADPEGNDISGAVTDTDGSWNMQNFNNKVVGFQDGQKPIVYNGSGTFATVSESSGTAPTIADGVGLCAYGRVWGLDADRQVIKFTGLLDETNWGSTGSGQIDMQNIWTRGTDQVTAIVAFNGALVVFGLKHIIVWVDGVGAQLGIDPDNLYVSEVIEGTGCVSQHSIQKLGEADMVFASPQGLQTLGRVLSSGGSMPAAGLTKAVASQFIADIEATTDKDEIRSVVDPKEGFYLITFPTQGRTWCFFYRRVFQDEDGAQLMPITTWQWAPTAWLRDNGNTRLLAGGAGNVLRYDGGAQSDDGADIDLDYESAWLDLGEGIANRLKILKRIGAILFVTSAETVNFKWDWDFKDSFSVKSKEFFSSGAAEWNLGEWGLAEWAGGNSLRILKFPAYGTGQYIKVGFTASVSTTLAIQQMEIFSKLGRIA